MERRLLRLMAIADADRARTPGAAAIVKAIGARFGEDMLDTARNIIGVPPDRINGTAGGAGPVRTSSAGAWRGLRQGQFDDVSQHEGCPVGSPQSVTGMNERSDRRLCDGL